MAKLQNPNANDTPQIQLVLDGPHGSQKLKQVRPDTNRLDPIAGFVSAAHDALMLPPGFDTAVLHLFSLGCLGAFTASAVSLLPTMALICLGGVVIAASAFTIAAVRVAPSLAIPAALKVMVLTLGALLTL